MRDLANQSIIRRKSTAIGRIWIFVVAILIVIVLVAIFQLKSGSSMGGTESVNLSDAPKGLTPVKLADVADISGGINLSKNTISLTDVKHGGSASGTTTRTFGDGSYSLSVSATLPDPKGDKYQVWLTNGSAVKNAGFMNGSKNSWSLVFNDKDLYSKYNEIWLTREITMEDGKPETHVLEGSF